MVSDLLARTACASILAISAGPLHTTMLVNRQWPSEQASGGRVEQAQSLRGSAG